MPTDLASGGVDLIQRTTLLSWTPFVKSGLRIARAENTESYGTAGIIVRKTGAATGAHLMTNGHVLGIAAKGTDQGALEDNAVYSPHIKRCCEIQWNVPIGRIDAATSEQRQPEYMADTRTRIVQKKYSRGQETFAVDAALVELAADINSYNRMPEIGPIKPPRDLIQEWDLGTPRVSLDLAAGERLHVRKYGGTTGLTDGTIVRLVRYPMSEAPVPPDAANVERGLVFEVEPSAAVETFEREFALDLDAYRIRKGATTLGEILALYAGVATLQASIGGKPTAPTLKLKGRTFAKPGDSGSPIVDDENRLVGLLFSSDDVRVFVKGQLDDAFVSVGRTRGIFIEAALKRLGVTFLEAGQHAAGAPIMVPGMTIARPTEPAPDWAALDGLRARIDASPAGSRLAALFRAHLAEIRRLLHHRRRVTVTWHRFKGPAFTVAMLRAARQPAGPIPTEIDGVSLPAALDAMLHVLQAEGSEALRAALRVEAPTLRELAATATTFQAVADALAGASPCAE